MTTTASIPNHVAIILDGNRRWAKQHKMPPVEGYRRSYKNIVEIARHLWSKGVSTVTIWGFSTENWKRSPEEISRLMELFLSMDSYIDEFTKNKVCVTHLGRKDKLPKAVVDKIEKTEHSTERFSKFYLNVAIDYGGHDELVRACNRHLKKYPGIEFTEETLASCLDTANLPFPEPDLVIRTGGMRRLSGFMSWQIAYSELTFVEDFLPDFSKKRVDEVLADYSTRQRRFGT